MKVLIEVDKSENKIVLKRMNGDTFTSTDTTLNEDLGDFLFYPDESPSPEGWVSVEIEFGSHLRCMLSFSGDELKIDGAVNGWGNPVTADEIKITKLPKPPKQ